MPLASGTKLGPYETLAPLGAGGMGEVYRAHDTKLNREVALKVLPEAFAKDAERMARFHREAQVLASLNHPNIAAIHGLEESGDVRALVMELVEGPTLAELLENTKTEIRKSKTGTNFDFRVSNFEPLAIARQIAEGLEYAHEHGVVHRDLKPSNIKVGREGEVKLLDFGLAKALDTEGRVSNISDSPTLTATPTQTGVILGTAAYMSPEQARGKRVDKRADIWAFGVVLYEMLTGKRPFEGETTSDTLAAVLKTEPDWGALPAGIPAGIRRLLGRCLEKDPKLRLRDIGEARIALSAPEQLEPQLSVLPAADHVTAPSTGRWRWIATAALIAIAFAVGWWLHRPSPVPPPWKLTRLTADPGLSNAPALSPDGKLLAYASDRGTDGEPDLYVKQIAGGQAIRLTSDGAGNTTPDFSPDGGKIVFRSNRDGGGIYEIPAFGGDARLLARDGLDPKFSPDGSQVAYWVGDAGVSAQVPGSGAVWVVPTAGGTPERVGANFTAARDPIWSPDGKQLLVAGYTSAKAYQGSGIDWWLVPTQGGEAVRTGVYEALTQAGLILDPATQLSFPACWPASTNSVIFAAGSGDASNLWEIGIAPQTGRVNGAPRRLTTSAEDELEASCAAGDTLAFTSGESQTEVWSLPVDLDRGTPKSALQQVTQGPAGRAYPSLSSNGRNVAFSSDQSGQINIWIRDLVTGKESSVASSSLEQAFPVINASGTRVAYSVYEKAKRAVYVSAPGGAPEKLCEGCLRATGWSRDEKTLLVFGGDPYQINLLDIASHQQTPLLKHSSYHVLYGRFSPDNRWVSFTVRTGPNRGYIAVAPIDGPKPVPESAWITITPSDIQDWANWSPDGKTLYFTSRRDGHRCLWAQRLDPASHRPSGEAFTVEHFHGRVSYQQGGWSAAGGRIALVLVENTGNIWMMSRAGGR